MPGRVRRSARDRALMWDSIARQSEDDMLPYLIFTFAGRISREPGLDLSQNVMKQSSVQIPFFVTVRNNGPVTTFAFS